MSIDNNVPSHQILVTFENNQVQTIGYSSFLNTEVVDHFELNRNGNINSLTGSTPPNVVEELISQLINLTGSTTYEVCNIILTHIQTVYDVKEKDMLYLVHDQDEGYTLITFAWDEKSDTEEEEPTTTNIDYVYNFIKQIDDNSFIRVVVHQPFSFVFCLNTKDSNDLTYYMTNIYNYADNDLISCSGNGWGNMVSEAVIATINKEINTLHENHFDLDYLNANYNVLTKEKHIELFGVDPTNG